MKKKILSVAVLAAFMNVSLLAEPWFDAKIGETAAWPANNEECVVEGAGTWKNTSFAELTGGSGSRRLAVSAPRENCLQFVLSDPKVAGEEFTTVSTEVRLAVADPEEPLSAAAPLCALTPVRVGADETAYFGLALDEDGGTNVWTRLSGAAPQEGATVTLSFSTKEGADGVKLVRYAVNGQVLTLNDREWLPMEAGDEDDPMSIVSVRYSGSGEVGSLKGVVGGDSPGELTVVEPGSPAVVAAADAAAAIAAVTFRVQVPLGSKGEPVAAEAEYRGYFTLQATPVAGKDGVFEVAAVLNAAVVQPVIAVADEIMEPLVVGAETCELKLRALPGLYYSLLRGAALPEIDDVRDCQLATTTQVLLRDEAKLPDAAFYRVEVTIDARENAD